MQDDTREKDGLLDSRLAGAFIRAKMEEKGIQIQQMADKLGIGNPSQLSNLLAGRSNIARSSYFRAIAQELRLTMDEIEYLNPNVIFTHPDTPRLPAAYFTAQTMKELPEELQAAAQAMRGLGYNLPDSTVRRLLPQGLDGKSPQTKEQWMDFLLAMRQFF